MLTALAAAGVHRALGQPPKATMQGLLLAAPSLALLASPRLVRQLLGAGRLYAACGAAVIAALLFGHFHGAPHDTFPFAPWEMYGRPPRPEVVFYDYTAVLRDGTRLVVKPADNLPLFRKLYVRLAHLADALETTADDDYRGRLSANFDALLQADARIYNRAHAANPVRAFEVGRNTVRRGVYCGPPCVRRVHFRTVEVAGD